MRARSGRGAPFREDLLHAGESEDGEAPGPERVFSRVELEAWREGVFELCWQQHGGSGLGVTVGEALEMSIADRDWFLERIGAQRSHEAREIEKAAKRR